MNRGASEAPQDRSRIGEAGRAAPRRISAAVAWAFGALLAWLTPAVVAAAPAEWVYWGDYGTNTISRVRPDGSSATVLLSGLAVPSAIAIDAGAEHLYWVEVTGQKIRRASLTGLDGIDILSTAPASPYGLAIDPVGNKLYWSEYSGGIRRANLDGSDVESLLATSGAAGLTIDANAGKIYWADYWAGTVSRANLDGSGVETLVSGRSRPNHVALDIEWGRLYWTEGLYSGQVESSDLDGGDLVTVVAGEASPTGLAFDPVTGMLYWAVEDGYAVRQSNTAGAGLATLVGGLSRPLGVAILAAEPPPTVTAVATVHGPVVPSSATHLAIDQWTLTFSESIADAIADVGIDVNISAGDFLLAGDGGDGTIETLDCASGVAPTDQAISLAPNSFLNATLELLVNFNGGALAEGRYRFFVCADSTLVDADGNALDGDGDGVAGDDFVLDLQVDQTAPSVPTSLSRLEAPESSCTNLTQFTMEWSGAADEAGGSGLAGYSFVFEGASDPGPDAVIDLPQGSDPHSYSVALAESPAGVWFFSLRTCDVAGNCAGSPRPAYVVDTTAPPSPEPIGSSHAVGVASADSTIDLFWGALPDNLCGTDGYSLTFDPSPVAGCSQVKGYEESATSATDLPLADGTWFAHVCALDNAGNWGPAATGGPYVVDTAGPGTVGSLTSPTHATPSPALVITFGWQAAVDSGAGLDGYWYGVDESPTASCGAVRLIEESVVSLATDLLPPGSYYFHICAVDNLGLWGPVVTGGPYVVQPNPAAAKYLFFSDVLLDTIERMRTDGTERTTVLSGLADPWGVAVDEVGGKLYWTEYGTGSIRRADLDGSAIETLHVDAATPPMDLELDLLHGKMYWSSYVAAQVVRRANLDGSNPEDVATGLSAPTGLGVDPVGGKVYWAEEFGNRVARADLDGANQETLWSGFAPTDVAIDAAHGDLYWTAGYGGSGSIVRARLDGSSPSVLAAAQAYPLYLTVDPAEGRVYWGDWDSDTIERVYSNGSGRATLLTGIPQPMDLALASIAVSPPGNTTVRLVDSTGDGLAGAVVGYYQGGWKAFGTTGADGRVARSLTPGTYPFRITYGGATIQKSQNIASQPEVLFATRDVTVRLEDSSGSPLDIGVADYYAGGWKAFGSTSGGAVHLELLPASYPFRISWGGASVQKSQNIGVDPVVVFATRQVTVALQDSSGDPLDTGVVDYYAAGWKPFGTTSGGSVQRELLPGAYTMRIAYGGATVQKVQDLGANPLVVFATRDVTVSLQDSTGSPLDTGVVDYYGGGWRSFGTTSGGSVHRELLPVSYTVRIAFGGATVQKSQDVGANPVVTFATRDVTVALRDASGNPLDTGAADYYAGGWKPFGTTVGGAVHRELLPGTYTLRIGFAGASVQKSQDVGVQPEVAFQTGAVVSDSGTCNGVYAAGWRTFEQGMQLLPGSYTFRFTSGTPTQESFATAAGIENHIR